MEAEALRCAAQEAARLGYKAGTGRHAAFAVLAAQGRGGRGLSVDRIVEVALAERLWTTNNVPNPVKWCAQTHRLLPRRRP